MDTTLKESFLKSIDPVEISYKKFIDNEYHYEINNFDWEEPNDDKFPDDLIPRFYKCEEKSFFKRKLLKSGGDYILIYHIT